MHRSRFNSRTVDLINKVMSELNIELPPYKQSAIHDAICTAYERGIEDGISKGEAAYEWSDQ